MTVRESNRFDATIDSIQYRFKRDGDEPPWQKEYVRSGVNIQQDINQGTSQFNTRPDIRTVFQTSWAGGSRWEKPLLSQQSIDSYNISEGFDLTATPGDVIPLPDIAAISGGTINDNPFALVVSPTVVYYFEDQKASLGLVQWNGSSFSTLSNDFGNGASDTPIAMCWNKALLTAFALFNDGDVRYVTPDSAGGTVIDSGTPVSGSNIFMHNGRLLVYDGSTLQEVSDPLGSPALSTVYSDGLGSDALSGVTDNTTDPVTYVDWGSRLAIATSEGIYIVKNVIQEGLVTAFITRVDRDNAGTDIGIPIATLPPGMACLNIYYHLGSLVMACTPDIYRLFDNDIGDSGHIETYFYHLTNESLGTIGSPLGPDPDESVYRFLGVNGARLYIGGTSRIWVYDAVRGGLHPLLDDDQSAAGGTWGSMANTLATDEVLQFFHDDSPGLRLPLIDEGGNTMTHSLDSNYFDGNIPAEVKTVYAVTLMTDGMKSGETWTVSLSTDDGAFGSVATFTSADANTTRKAFSSTKQGYRFRYRLAYTATSDISAPSHVKGIVFHMLQGEFVTQWTLLLDGREAQNVEGQVVRPADIQSNLETLGAEDDSFTYVDEYQGDDNASTHTVKLQGLQISKRTPNEIDVARVVLVEQ